MKLHLGCGKRHIDLPGWVHVDVTQYPHVDHVCDIRRLPFDNDVADLIYACTVLEHFDKSETVSVLSEWRRVLRPGGVLRLSVPDFAVLSRIYQSGHCSVFGERVPSCDLDLIQGMIVGGQRDEWDFHKNVFDRHRLTRYLSESGFVDVRAWDWRSTEHAHVDDYSRAYLPHMDFDNGVNTSLNLEATKPGSKR